MNSPNKTDNPAPSLFWDELEMYFLISLSLRRPRDEEAMSYSS